MVATLMKCTQIIDYFPFLMLLTCEGATRAFVDCIRKSQGGRKSNLTTLVSSPRCCWVNAFNGWTIYSFGWQRSPHVGGVGPLFFLYFFSVFFLALVSFCFHFFVILFQLTFYSLTFLHGSLVSLLIIILN